MTATYSGQYHERGNIVRWSSELEFDCILFADQDGIGWFAEQMSDAHGWRAWQEGVRLETERNTVTRRQMALLRGLLDKPIELYAQVKDPLLLPLYKAGLIDYAAIGDFEPRTDHAGRVFMKVLKRVTITADGRKRIGELFIKGVTSTC
jgi:hypothetical protein